MLYGSWSEEARNYLRDTKSFSARNLFLQTNESGSYDCTQENGGTIRGTGTEHEETPVRYKYDVRRNKYVEELNYGTQSFELFSGAESRSEWYWFPKIFQTWFAQQNTNFKLKCALFFELPGRTFCHAFQARQIPFPLDFLGSLPSPFFDALFVLDSTLKDELAIVMEDLLQDLGPE